MHKDGNQSASVVMFTWHTTIHPGCWAADAYLLTVALAAAVAAAAEAAPVSAYLRLHAQVEAFVRGAA